MLEFVLDVCCEVVTRGRGAVDVFAGVLLCGGRYSRCKGCKAMYDIRCVMCDEEEDKKR
jgi:hypothetical protein